MQLLQVRKLVKEHVTNQVKSLDIENKFFREHIIPQYFELDHQLYYFSYYILPNESPVEPPPPP